MAAPEDATGEGTSTRSQISITLLFFALFLIAGHLGIWFVLFPVHPGTRLLGFPAHYALALLAGWPVLLVLVVLYARIANRLDDRIGRGASAKRTANEPEDG